MLQGLLVATELRDRVCPHWLPPLVHEPPFVVKVLEALTTTGCHDNIDHERCAPLPCICQGWNTLLFFFDKPEKLKTRLTPAIERKEYYQADPKRPHNHSDGTTLYYVIA